MLTAMGGEVRGDQLMLLSGIDREGEFVVCHAYYIEDTYAKPQYYDEDFVPQRAYKFNGVYRDTVVPVLEPSDWFSELSLRELSVSWRCSAPASGWSFARLALFLAHSDSPPGHV